MDTPHRIVLDPTPSPEPKSSGPTAPPRRRRGFVGPILLIAFGIIFLLNNLGLLSWNVWGSLWKLWPLWLIAAGVDMMFGGRSRAAGWVVLGLVTAFLGGAVWWGGSALRSAGAGEPLTGDQVQQAVGSATRAEVSLKPAVSRLAIRAGEPANLVDGTVHRQQGERVVKEAGTSGETLSYSLKSEAFGSVGLNIGGTGATWDLALSPAIPMALRVETGVGEADLDLKQLTITDLRVQSGVGKTVLTLPAKGNFQGNIQTGVGAVEIRVPAGMAVRVVTKVGIGAPEVSGNFERRGDTFSSPGFDSAANRAELQVEGGVGSIRIMDVN